VSTRTDRAIVRTTAGLSLLLILAAPLSLVPTIWSGDFRWLLSGVVLGLVGLGIGVVIRDTGRHTGRHTRPADTPAPEKERHRDE
jgi:hypothetical protein